MKKGRVFWGTAFLFFVVTMPFRQLFGMAGLTEVRPASAFPVIFGMLYGLPAAVGCAVGNLAADFLSGYPLPVCLYGFVAQFLYGWLPHLLWKWSQKGNQEDLWFRSVSDLRRFFGIVFADSLLMALALGGMLQLLNMGVLWSQSTLLLFFNNLVFSVLLGIPLILLCSFLGGTERRHILTLNVRFVLIFLTLSLLSAALMGISSYVEAVHYTKDALELWNRVYIRVSVDFFLLCGVSLYFLQYLQNKITLPIEKLSEIAAAYANGERRKGDCEELAALPGEPGKLALTFGTMMEDMERYIQDIMEVTAEKERIRTEIQVASRLQADMLPEAAGAFGNRKEFSLYASMTPAKGVGGDFYDFFLLDEDQLVLVMADVSGKGVPAALFMVVARTLIRSHITAEKLRKEGALAAVAGEINECLCRNNKNGMFVTAWIGVLKLSTGELNFVNAGHCRPLIRHQNGRSSYETALSGFVLAGMEGSSYCQEKRYLGQEDTLFLYTDGVTEATSSAKELYGEERLQAVAEKKGSGSPQELLQTVWQDVEEFQRNAEQFDDITMLAVTYHGSGIIEKRGVPRMEYVCEFTDFTEHTLKEKGVSMKTRVKFLMAVDEIFSNICYYSDAEKVTIGIRVEENGMEGKAVTLYFEDDGIPYNPLERQEPDVGVPLEKKKIGGLGIHLVRNRMDWMDYVYVDGKNRLTIEKMDD